MNLQRVLLAASVLIGLLLLLFPPSVFAQDAATLPLIDKDDIGGVVTGPSGPEAGVWVIAETAELPTKFTRIVVTDEQGRYVIPDLPVADYQVWVRGYGLVDSPKLRGKPGQILNHAAIPAPTAAAAAHYYPAIHWFSMIRLSPASAFGGSSDFPKNVTRESWLRLLSNINCVGCHQIGQESTRTIPAAFGTFASSEEAWMRRTQSGQAGEAMTNRIAGTFGTAPYKYFGEWTDRIAKGELPHTKPERPQGEERNVVVTAWEWSEPNKYLHDLISSDKRYPTVNGYGPLYGSPEYSTDWMPILDPKTNKVTSFRLPVPDPNMPVSLGPGHAASVKPLQPSAYWGEEVIWDTRANNHNAMFDKSGRLWLTTTIRTASNPDFCKNGSEHPSAKAFPLDVGTRQAAMLDPSTMKYHFIDTCFSTHHLQFGFDADDTLWFSGGTGGFARDNAEAAGWLNTKKYIETGDAVAAQGWAPFVLDTNGNGKLDEYVEPNQPVYPGKDKRITNLNPYAVMPHPQDGSIWYTVGVFGGRPGFLRFDPSTKLSEIYYMPKPGIGIRGADIDSKGVLWGSGSGGYLVSFDRSKCRSALSGPKALGDHCPEGWSFHRYPGPSFEGETDSAEASYYTWVDQHNILGLGNDVPISTANLSDGFVAFKDGKFISLRIPYPMGFFAKGLDGRIDNPSAGWKGRGLWTASGDRTPWLMEGGKGSRPRAVHIQLRPDPLAH